MTMQLQSVLELTIIANCINMDLIQAAISILDILHWINLTLRPLNERVEEKEFLNESVNSSIELTVPIQNWVKQTLAQARNHQKVTHSNHFNICSYNWLMNLTTKGQMLNRYFETERMTHRSLFELQQYFDPSFRSRYTDKPSLDN